MHDFKQRTSATLCWLPVLHGNGNGSGVGGGDSG